MIPGNSPESILFEGHNLGNIIRYSPNAFLDDNADSTEIKIQYMMMRTGADYEIVSGRFSRFLASFLLADTGPDLDRTFKFFIRIWAS